MRRPVYMNLSLDIEFGFCRLVGRGFPISRVVSTWPKYRQMDNRELNLAIPETRAESLTSGDGIGPEDEDESDIKETLEYVALCPRTPNMGLQSRVACVFYNHR